MGNLKNTMNILSINFNHDGAGVILCDGRIAAYVNTERYSRIKKHPGIRNEDLKELLNQADIELKNINLVCVNNYGWQPSPDIVNRHGNDLTHTFLDLSVDISASTVMIQGQTFPAVINLNHWLIHNAAAYYTSEFSSAVCFSWDPTGMGVAYGQAEKLYYQRFKYDINPAHTFNACSQLVFSEGLFGAGKLMGLAPYGTESKLVTSSYHHVRWCGDLSSVSALSPVSITSNGKAFNAALAFHAQEYLNTELIRILTNLKKEAVLEKMPLNLCLSGGTSLNSVANQIAFSESGFDEIHLTPACGDDGTAIGAALFVYHHLLGNARKPISVREYTYSPRMYSRDALTSINSHSYRHLYTVTEVDDKYRVGAELLAQGKIVGWYQGGSEIGPRALGNRSILADPRDAEMKDKINSKIKFRESFRPFAPAVLDSKSSEYFSIKESPHMLRVCDVVSDSLPAITHVDGTSRVQTVTAEINDIFYKLLLAFNKKTKCPVLLNTSFNIKGEPIVETPENAIDCFLGCGLDALIIEDYLILKQDADAKPQFERKPVAVPKPPSVGPLKRVKQTVKTAVRKLVV